MGGENQPMVGKTQAQMYPPRRRSSSGPMRVTGFPAISKTNADLLIETGLVSARSTSSPPTVTSNASFTSTEFVSSIPSKVMVSVSPFTNADENAAGGDVGRRSLKRIH